MNRPSFVKMESNFSIVNVPVKEVGNKIGGKVKENIDGGFFKNACAIRMSYALNYSEFPIDRNSEWATSSGGDKKWYIYKVLDLVQFLNKTLGKPDISIKSNVDISTFKNKKGIIIFNTYGWSDATGHATLWSDSKCADLCYFDRARGVLLWELK